MELYLYSPTCHQGMDTDNCKLYLHLFNVVTGLYRTSETRWCEHVTFQMCIWISDVSLPWHEFCYANIIMILKSNIHSFSGLQQMLYKAVLNTDAPLVTRHIPWDRATCHTTFRDSLLQQAVPGWTAAVCCCLPALEGLCYLEWCDGQSVSTSQHRNRRSLNTPKSCVLPCLSGHTHICYRCCVTSSQMKEASQTDVEGISCDSLEDITPADRQTTNSWNNLTPNPSYVLRILCGLEWRQLSIKTHMASRGSQNVQRMLVIPTTL